MKFHFLIILAAILLINIALASAESHKTAARDACADDYWKWCTPGEAPFDCFKRRGFFKKESMLSLECKQAWARIKIKHSVGEDTQTKESTSDTTPQKLKAEPKKPASVEPPKELPKKEETKTPEVDDFSDLEFQ